MRQKRKKKMPTETIKCRKCKGVIILGPVDGSGKRHGHCKKCKLEYHMLSNGYIYNHKHDAFKQRNHDDLKKKQAYTKEKRRLALSAQKVKKQKTVKIKLMGSIGTFGEIAMVRAWRPNEKGGQSE